MQKLVANSKKSWTEADIQYLSDNYGRVKTATIASNLGRTYDAVVQCATRSGIRLTDSFLTAIQVGEIMGVDSKTVKLWIERGKLKAKKSNVVRRGKHSAWVVEHTALEDFIKTYTQSYDLRRISRDEHLFWRNLAEKHVPKGQVPSIARVWTEREDAFLLNNRGKLTYKELGVKLNRTYGAVHKRIGLLREKGRLVPPSKLWEKRDHATERDWTAAEDEFLKANYRRLRNPGESGWGNRITAEELAKMLNRTKDSCLTRAHRLQITQPTKIAS